MIEESNSTFVELSRYSADDLHGAPHNIIRHPFMPSGIFHLMWERLKAGKSFAGYVRNLAADGETYDVFATVTPIPGTDSFLFVRQRPCHDDNRALAMTVYEGLSGQEQGLAGELGRREVAARGSSIAQDVLADAGFPDFESYMSEMMYWEIICREGMSGGLPERPGATGAWAERLDAAKAIHGALDEWMAGMGQLVETAEKADVAKGRLVSTLGRAAEIRDQVAGLDVVGADAERLSVLSFQLNVWAGMQDILDSYVTELAELLAQVAHDAREARLGISITRLHTTMLATFVAQAVDSVDGAGAGVEVEGLETKLTPLQLAAADSVETMESGAFSRGLVVKRAVSRLRSVVGLMESPRTLLAEALDQAQSLSAEALGEGDLVARVGKTLAEADAAMAEMAELAATLENAVVAPDAAPVLDALRRFKDADV